MNRTKYPEYVLDHSQNLINFSLIRSLPIPEFHATQLFLCYRINKQANTQTKKHRKSSIKAVCSVKSDGGKS